MEKQFKLWNVIVGWVVFAIAAATYLLTIEPTVSRHVSADYRADSLVLGLR